MCLFVKYSIAYDVWQSILTVLSKEQFSTETFKQQVPVPFPTSNAVSSNSSVVTHCIFRHVSGHVIHLVVFYQRGNDKFLWHGCLPDENRLGLRVGSVQFGRHEGAYNR